MKMLIEIYFVWSRV